MSEKKKKNTPDLIDAGGGVQFVAIGSEQVEWSPGMVVVAESVRVSIKLRPASQKYAAKMGIYLDLETLDGDVGMWAPGRLRHQLIRDAGLNPESLVSDAQAAEYTAAVVARLDDLAALVPGFWFFACLGKAPSKGDNADAWVINFGRASGPSMDQVEHSMVRVTAEEVHRRETRAEARLALGAPVTRKQLT